jgi:cell division protein FtsB
MKKNKTKVGFWRQASVSVLVLMITSGVLFGHQILSIYHMNQQIKALTVKKQKLVLENKRAQEQVKGLQSDETLEKLAREELGMIKPGEKILVKVVSNGQKSQ